MTVSGNLLFDITGFSVSAAASPVGPRSRPDDFACCGADGPNGLGTKAAMVGWLFAEAEKADVGTYALSNDAFLTDVALHNAPFGVDLVGHYGQPSFVFHPG